MRTGAGVRRWRWVRPGRPARATAAVDADLRLRMLQHELRTPVGALVALTRALADDGHPLTPAARQEVAVLARDHADHLQRLLQPVAVPDDRRARITAPEPTAPLGRILPLVGALVPPGRLRTRTSRRAGQCPVSVDRTRQVLVNLVENALRHGPPEGIVGIDAVRRRAGLTIMVTDEGRTPDPVIAALRRPAPTTGGAGLGLWIVRRLLAVDGARIAVHRLRPHGVGVEVVFPTSRPSARPG